jgi:hypothetical protein
MQTIHGLERASQLIIRKSCQVMGQGVRGFGVDDHLKARQRFTPLAGLEQLNAALQVVFDTARVLEQRLLAANRPMMGHLSVRLHGCLNKSTNVFMTGVQSPVVF